MSTVGAHVEVSCILMSTDGAHVEVSCIFVSTDAELGRRERLRIIASPTRKHFDDATRKDAPPLKTTRTLKTRRVTDAKFRVTGVSDIS